MAVVRRSLNARVGLTAAFLSITLAGCRQTSSEYVEAELRVQSRKVADLQNILAQRDAEIQTLRSTVTTYQASHVKPTEAPETVYRDTALSRISLTLATGGKDADLDGKDDGMVVGVAPHDYDGDAFKCPGNCKVQLFEAPASGARKQIGEWIFPAERLRTLWRSSLLGQGYHLTFGWQTPPTEKRLRVLVTFSTVDGRTFEAEKEFDVSLQAKGPPKLPGGRLDAEPTESPVIETKAPISTDPPKPAGLGSLKPLGSNLVLGPVPAALPPPPAKPAALSAPRSLDAKKPEAANASPSETLVKKPAVPNAEHSRPPIVDLDRRDVSLSGSPSPGDQADVEDVIVLPAAGVQRTAAVPVAPPKAEPPKVVSPKPQPPKVETKVNLPSPLPKMPPPKNAIPLTSDRIVLPDDPPPPPKKLPPPPKIELP
jgi:hypothetical protein